jgi:insertion element IS1 protein InsB
MQRLRCPCVLEPSRSYTEEQREQIIQDYYEHSSMRGVRRVFGVSRPTLSKWLKKDESNPPTEETFLPAQPSDELELDEMWSFVLKKSKKCWLWAALCCRTRQIIAHVIGDRNVKTCRKLWKLIPDEYTACCSYSDFWDAYEKVFPKETHRSVGKDTG